MPPEIQPPQVTPFDLIGGTGPVQAVVNRFYDLMDGDPGLAELRALHAPDLEPMRRSLTGFLTGWLGGPRDWFDEHPGKCMMSMHAGIPITQASARQWTEAMARALADCRVEPDLADRINEAFGRMAPNMVR